MNVNNNGLELFNHTGSIQGRLPQNIGIYKIEDSNSSDAGVNIRELTISRSLVNMSSLTCTNFNEDSSQESVEDRESTISRSPVTMSSLTCTNFDEDSCQESAEDFEERKSDSSSSYKISLNDLDYDFLYK
mgnify:FL=1